MSVQINDTLELNAKKVKKIRHAYIGCKFLNLFQFYFRKDILTLNSSEADKLKSLSLQLESQISCDILGNDVTLIDYAFAAMMLFFALVIIIVMIYIYVQINIRKVKK